MRDTLSRAVESEPRAGPILLELVKKNPTGSGSILNIACFLLKTFNKVFEQLKIIVLINFLSK